LVLARAPSGEEIIKAIGLIDLATFVVLVAAVIGLVRGWKGELSRDSMLLLLGILIASLLHSVSNVLEWGGITAALDPYEDYFQLIEPILWFLFTYSFLRSRETKNLVESEERYRALYEDLPDAVFLADASTGIIVGANHAATRLLARSLSDIVGLHQTDIHPGDTAEMSRRIFSSQRSESEERGHAAPMQHSVIRSDGQHVPVEITASFVSLAGRPIMQGVFRDNSVRQRAADLLRQQKELAKRYLDIASVAIIAVDREGRLTLINQRGLEIFEYDHERDLLGRDWFETCIPSSSTAIARSTFLGQVMAGTRPTREFSEASVITRSGKQRIIAWHNIVLRDADGSITGLLSSGQDITDQREAERARMEVESQLRQVQKLESIGTLASGAAHEINNPLTGIINYAQLIHDRIDDDSLREFATGIIEEGNRVASIVKGLLSFSSQQNERHSLAIMSDIVDTTISLIGSLLRKDQIQLTVEIEPDLPLLKCQSQQIEQILINLLTNARDALNDRYPEFDEDKVLRVTVDVIQKEGQSWIRTIVEDHGSGIPAGIVSRIFDPFFSTKPREKGTGLGLSISYGLVREHQGHLFVESEPNDYTRFTIELPIESSWSLDTQERGREEPVWRES
jgi:PAS domain S-box-containing protein